MLDLSIPLSIPCKKNYGIFKPARAMEVVVEWPSVRTLPHPRPWRA